jgi:hypothetical protein
MCQGDDKYGILVELSFLMLIRGFCWSCAAADAGNGTKDETMLQQGTNMVWQLPAIKLQTCIHTRSMACFAKQQEPDARVQH